MKAVFILSLCIGASVAATPFVTQVQWNELMGAAIFPEDVNTARSRSGESSVLVQELQGLVDDADVFNKVYTTYNKLFAKHLPHRGVDVVSRAAVFKANVMAIAKHNLEEKAGLHTYQKGVNQFTGLTDLEFAKLYTIPSLNLTAYFENSGAPRMEVELDQSKPTPVNWVTKGTVTAVKDQGQCGSCYAFATIGVLESSYANKTAGKPLLDLSEQQMVDCSKNSGCNGGFWYNANDYLKNGIVNETSYAYTSGVSKNAGSCDAKKSANKAVYLATYTVLSSQDDETAMANALFNNGPLAVAVSTNGWSSYRSGIFNGTCGSSGVDHAVILVAANATEYTIKNSWSTSWGESGFIRLPTGVNKCLVARYPCWARAK